MRTGGPISQEMPDRGVGHVSVNALWLFRMAVVSVCITAVGYAQQSDKPQLSISPAAVKTTEPASANLLRDLDSSLETLVAKVSPAVVQIIVTGYGPSEDHGHDTAVVTRRHAIGSGIIVDSDGYIITNAHVVEGAQRVRVLLRPPAEKSLLDLQPLHAQQILEAKVVGTHKQSDLALLKVEATNLPTIRLRNGVPVRQGELVFALGSPEGLRDSVTMGIISSVARQTDPDQPMVYIQTDAALNPGNSGGPLVDIDGNLVGLNTLIFSEGGGSEGLGFAIPAAIVNFDYQNLRKYGRVQRVALGARTQTLTTTMAAGLGLTRSWGAIVSDIKQGGAAEAAGLQINDIVIAMDDHPILGLPDVIAALYLHPRDRVLKLDILRDKSRMSFNVPVQVFHDSVDDLDDVPGLQKSLIRKLSVFVTDLDSTIRPMLQNLRSDSGVLVIAQTASTNGVDTGLEKGDIIRSVNHTPAQSSAQLNTIVHNLKPGDPVVLQVERSGNLQYLAFEME